MNVCHKTLVQGHIVKLLRHKQDDRGMVLIEHESRCVQRYQIHELVTTDHQALKPGNKVNSVGFLGFVELSLGGIIERGADVFIGVVVGFDECHWPNHYNIIIQATERLTADDINLALGADIQFCVRDR
jgi:hypothetical protein